MKSSYLKLKKNLEYDFLFNNEMDSLNLLMSLLDYEYMVTKFQFKFQAIDHITKYLRRHLRYRRDREYIIEALKKILVEDINKLEIAIALDAYQMGYHAKDCVNEFEIFILKHMPMMNQSLRSILFHYPKSKKMKEMKEKILERVPSKDEYERRIKWLVSNYSERILLPKIMRLNKYMNKPMVIRNTESGIGITEDNFISKPELIAIYEKIRSYYMKSLIKISKECIWNGINDRLISRY